MTRMAPPQRQLKSSKIVGAHHWITKKIYQKNETMALEANYTKNSNNKKWLKLIKKHSKRLNWMILLLCFYKSLKLLDKDNHS